MCLPELTRRPVLLQHRRPDGRRRRPHVEDVETGPTVSLAEELATGPGITVHASLYERADDGGLGYNTAVCVDSGGKPIARTRKNHIPAFPGCREDLCFRPGDSGFPVLAHAGARCGFPTCWDEWFPRAGPRVLPGRGGDPGPPDRDRLRALTDRLDAPAAQSRRRSPVRPADGPGPSTPSRTKAATVSAGRAADPGAIRVNHDHDTGNGA
ncbi:nitrilase-related carbon-nitrogen hydrolase [Streptomyces sp. NPDC051704]|uniref:nitrilase-related carbon-nitrogen hydrolase n=1 Tax=Streptomyces sp. NPDC051704 TaxID=3365671 RepID=UPI00378F88F0